MTKKKNEEEPLGEVLPKIKEKCQVISITSRFIYLRDVNGGGICVKNVGQYPKAKIGDTVLL